MLLKLNAMSWTAFILFGFPAPPQRDKTKTHTYRNFVVTTVRISMFHNEIFYEQNLITVTRVTGHLC